MKTQIQHLSEIRNQIINELSQHTLKQLLYIPSGFNNNIFWNAAHIVATQQLVHYYLTDNKMLVDTTFIEKYKKGSFGNTEATEKDLEELISLLDFTPKQLYKDYEAEKLAYYRPYDTSFRVRLESIADAISFNNIHEGIHLGYIWALKRKV